MRATYAGFAGHSGLADLLPSSLAGRGSTVDPVDRVKAQAVLDVQALGQEQRSASLPTPKGPRGALARRRVELRPLAAPPRAVVRSSRSEPAPTPRRTTDVGDRLQVALRDAGSRGDARATRSCARASLPRCGARAPQADLAQRLDARSAPARGARRSLPPDTSTRASRLRRALDQLARHARGPGLPVAVAVGAGVEPAKPGTGRGSSCRSAPGSRRTAAPGRAVERARHRAADVRSVNGRASRSSTSATVAAVASSR